MVLREVFIHDVMFVKMLAQSVLRDLWYEGCGQVGDKAQGEAKYFTIHETTTQIL